MSDSVIDASFAEIDPAADAPPAIWVEVLSRHGEVLARHRCTGPELRIGRGYTNDVVIDDPYVAAEHLRIARAADGSLVAEDLGSLNGTFVERDKARSDRILLDGDRRLRIGQTWLRIRDAAHPVADERLFQPQRRLLPLAGGLAAVLLGIEVLSVWLNETGEPKLADYLSPPLIVAVVLTVWTAIWSVLSRIFAGEARFERNLLIAVGGALVYSLWNEFAWLFSYAFASRALVGLGNVVFWLVIAGASFLHLRSMGPAHSLIKAGAVLLLAGIGLGAQTLSSSQASGGSPYLTSPRRLLPPAFRVAPLVDREAFAAELLKLKPKLDAQREATADDDGLEDDDED
jgi:hypothetical protein